MPRIGIDARKLDDGGIGRYVREVLARAPRLLPRAELVALAGAGAAPRIRLLAPGVEVVPVGAAGYSAAEHWEVARAASRARLDLLHVPHYVVPALARVALVVTVHDLIHRRLPATPAHALYARAMLALVRRRARLVLVPSEAVARDLVGLARVEAARVRVVPNGVSAEFLDRGPPPPDDVAAFVARRGLTRPYVLNVTNGLAHKGLDLLLGAADELPGLQLALAGRGSDRASARAAAARLGRRAGAVAFLGPLDDGELRLAYAGAVATVIASRLEGFGLPALEAMAVGGVVIAAAAGGVPEVVEDAAFLVTPGSVASLREALYRIAFELSPAEREASVGRGLARARQFPWERSVRATCTAYEQVLAGAT